MAHRGTLEVGDLVRGDREDKRLEGAPGVLVARQREEHRDTDLLRQVLHEVPRVPRKPGQTGAAVTQRERVYVGEQVVCGLLVAVDRAMDERTDPRRLVFTHRSMVP